MKHVSKILSTILVFCLLLSVLPAQVFATSFPDNTVEPANYTVGVSSKSELQERLNTLVAKYKDTYWTASGNPCSAHGTTCYSRYYYAWQCKGFAGYIFNDLFCGGNIGKYDSNMYYIPSANNATLVDKVWGISSSDTTSVKNILSKAQPGDYIQARRRNKSYGHTMIVLSVTDTGINIFDCNSDGKCGVKTYFQTWATFASKNSGFSLYHSTKYPSNGGETGCGCSTSYAGEYTCTTKAGSNLYIRTGHGGSYSTIGKIPSGATVTVTKASGTGDGDWAHVEYGGMSGYASMQYLKKKNTTNLPVGMFDGISAGPMTVNVRGWTFDSDDVNRSVEIHVYIGTTGIGVGHANVTREDVGAAYPGVGNNHGYSFECVVPDHLGGTQNVSVYAIDGEHVNNVLLGTKTVNILPKVQASPSSIELKLGENETATVTATRIGEYVGEHKIRSEALDPGIATGKWVSYSDHVAPLTVTAKAPGSTQIKISLIDSTTEEYLTSCTVNVKVTAKEYTVSYNANGGSGAPGSQVKLHNQTLTLSQTKPTRKGYSFVGWSTSSTASSASYAPGSSYTNNGNLTLYAVWKAEPANLESDRTGPFELTLGGTESQTINVTKSGYDTSNWDIEVTRNNSHASYQLGSWNGNTRPITFSASSTGTTKFTVKLINKNTKEILDTLTFDVTVTAKKYTIHYDANGGTGAPKDETKEHGSNGFTLSTVIPTRSGYTFDGWTLKRWETHPGIVGNVYEPGQTYLGNSDTTFYALWYKCNHSFGSWEQVTAPTCTKEGEEQRTCKNCGHSESRKVAPKGHTEVTDKAVAATCTASGKTEGKHCSVCNTVIVAQKTIPAKGHTEVTDKAVAATCTSAGKTEGKHCPLCNIVTVAQKTIPAKGHTEVTDKAVAATCTSAGKTEGKHCSVCNAVIVAQKSVAAKGHTEVIDKAVAATCTSGGKSEGKHCSVCNTVIVAQQSTPKKNHTEVIDAAIAATCTSTGKTEGKHCSVCNTVIIAQQTVPKCGHTEIVIPGSNNFTFGIKCSVCGKTILEQKAIAATADANPNSVYAPIIQAAISECVYNDEGYGALYDVDGNGTDELIMMYDAEVPVPQGSIFPCTVYSIYTLSDGQPVALIEKEILFTLAGGPFGHLAVVERDGSKYIFTTYESGETGGENIKRSGRCNLYKLDGATLVLDTSVKYTAQYGYYGINYNNSSATINGNTVSYQEYESWVDSLNELVIIDNMYEEDSKNAVPLEELYNMVMKSAGCSHSASTIPGKSATCTQIGYTSASYCTKCSAVLTPQQIVAPTGHVYSDAGDLNCNTCGQTRLLNANRPTVNMYRMYDPNSGEHFYTGSDEERNNLVSVGWNYEGVGFTFPLTTGLPVYRLYDPVHGEHLYTMDENEKATLINQGWKYEGIAFNSGFENEVPQYRLHNPNATRGAYHFTASIEERNTLISLGWEYQGIGWYSCWN